MSKLFKTFLEKYPITGNSLVYGTLCVAAETTQQILNKKLEEPSKPFDLESIKRFSIYGTAIGGPVVAIWYKFLDNKVSGTTRKTILKKVLIDQVMFSPNLVALFYVSMSALEGKQDITEELRSKFGQTLVANVLFWVPIQTINFSLIPNVYRVTYVAATSFIWLNILAWFKNQGEPQLPPTEQKENQ